MSVDTSAANAAAPLGAHGNGSQYSFPDSPTSILAGTKHGKPGPYVAPPIPLTFRESLGAWFKRSDSAAPELYLYRNTGYFQGASLYNAPNSDLLTAFQAAQAPHLRQAGQAKSHLQAKLHPRQAGSAPTTADKERATIGTQLSPDGKVGSIRMVDIGSQTSSGFASWFSSSTPRLINMLEIGKPRPAEEIQADTEEEKVVLLHGYGAGTGFFFQNLNALAQHPSSRLYALDWLGMGRSSRVPFHITSKQSKTTESRVDAAETFFVQALEDWRKTMGLKKMTLIGHSLGGYLSIAYSLRYPQHVNRLVLLSPAGIPEAPEEMRNSSASPSPPLAERQGADEVAAEVQQMQQDVAPQSREQERQDTQGVNVAAARTKRRGSSEVAERVQTVNSKTDEASDAPKPPRLRKRTRNVVQFLWEANLSPFAILRGSLFFAPMLAGGYTSRRFGSLPDEDLRTLHAYCYDIFTSRGSSEYCLAHLLAPFGYARLPMVHRIDRLPKTLPVTFIYGEQGIDWMDERGGQDSVQRLAKAGNPHARCFAVPHAGHHVYLDNPNAFNTLLGRVLNGQVDDAGKGGQAAG